MRNDGLPETPSLAGPVPGRIGNYEVLDRLGSDPVADVLKCRDPSAEGVVVIRRMRGGLAEPRSLGRLFLAEARLAQGLSHPSIARIHQVDELGGAPSMVVEHVEGPTLAQVVSLAMRQRRPCTRIVARVLAEIAAALAHAHLACDARGRPLGIVHREVTARNIKLPPKGVPKLLDFGVMRLPGRPTPAGACGPLRHPAPEQLRGPFVDGRSDVFAVGVCLYLAATGQLPSPSLDETTARRRGARGAHPRPPPDPSFEPELVELLGWAMNEDVERRPSALALSQALDGYASRGPEPVTLAMVGSFVRELLGSASEEDEATLDAEPRHFSFASGDEPDDDVEPPSEHLELREAASFSPRASVATRGWSALLRAWQAASSRGRSW